MGRQSHSAVSANLYRNVHVTPLENLSPVEIHLKDPLHSSYISNPSGIREERYIHEDLELRRRLPEHDAYTHRTRDVYKRMPHENQIELSRNRPLGQATANRGDHRVDRNSDLSSRNYKMAPRLKMGGFEGRGVMPTQERVDPGLGSTDPLKAELRRKTFEGFMQRNMNMNQ